MLTWLLYLYPRSGGEETVPAQEVHAELPAVRRGRGRRLEIQEHKADGAGGGTPRGDRTHSRTLPLFGPAPLQHREFPRTHRSQGYAGHA